MDHDFASNASERRVLLSHIIGKAREVLGSDTIISGFRKANHIPVGHRYVNGRFKTHLLPPPHDAVGANQKTGRGVPE